MNKNLTQAQRLIVAIVYLLLIGVIFSLMGGNLSKLLDSGYDESIWFYSGVLLIIMGQYVTEPFFSTPADSLANSLTLTFALLTVNDKSKLVGYNFVFIFALCMIIVSILAILSKDKTNKLSKVIYIIVQNLGSSKFVYSTVFLLSSYSYFAVNENNIPLFVISIAIWICIMFLRLAERVVKLFTKIKNILFSKSVNINFLGYAVKCYNAYLYSIELDKGNEYLNTLNSDYPSLVLIKTNKFTYSLGVVVRCNPLLDNTWIDVLLICDDSNTPIQIHQLGRGAQDLFHPEKIGSSFGVALEHLHEDMKAKLITCKIYTEFNDFIGFVEQGSNINTINFSILGNGSSSIKDGSIISTYIYGKEVLYQVINGITKEEKYDANSTNGYISGIARKIGVYDYGNNQLNIVKWMPKPGELVFMYTTNKDISLQELADRGIGRMPETDMIVPIADINSLVTHNTAILGILGVGKSCLTFELIKKMSKENIKFICIDITNQYYTDKGLFGYVKKENIIDDICKKYLDKLNEYSQRKGSKDKPSDWGNVNIYKSLIKKVLAPFLDSDKQVIILNPDNHLVKKPASLFNITESIELSVVEKTRIISELLLELCMEKGQTDTARYCLVYEEAHSLVPEWSSVANSGDERAANGTAKVILQGRKYGLGCILVTQRTANVTKSILNQCNTIFALRVFDDTGKTFLENYIGKDYADTLPTLEERHAIAIGKGLKVKQPIIIQLNDMKYIKSTSI